MCDVDFYSIILFFVQPDMGSEEESGKDWSDLEREAEEDDRNYNSKQDEYPAHKKKSSSGGDRNRDKHKSSSSSKNHR